MTVHSPPRPLRPLHALLPEGSVLYRVHRTSHGGIDDPGNRFNPGIGGPTRWAFFGRPIVPVLYAAASPEAAVFETLLHDAVPGSVVPAAYYRSTVLTVLHTVRDLPLAQFHSAGLRKLGLHAADLTDTAAETYPATVEWARAIHADTDLAGIEWMSRQYNSVACLVLFEGPGRASARDLVPAPDDPVGRNFALPHDQEWLAALAARADITIEV